MALLVLEAWATSKNRMLPSISRSDNFCAWQEAEKRSNAYLLDVVVGKSAAILELLAGENQTLLIRGNAFLVLDLGLDIVDSVARLHLKGDGLARQGLHEAVGSMVSILRCISDLFN